MAKWKRRAKYATVLMAASAVIGLACFYLLDSLFPFPLERIEDRMAVASARILASDGSLLSWRVDAWEHRRLAVRMDEVSPWLPLATVAVEDKRFYNHHGVDPVAVVRALLQNTLSRRRVSGASTITMQTIRLLWSRPRRWDSKIVEAFRAWQLERLADKNRILEIYLNLAPYGGNVIGVEAAARHYFGKSAKQLNLAEASLLAGLPQSPARLNPLTNLPGATTRRDFVIRCMLENKFVTPEQAARARSEAVELSSRERRVDAPHFVEYVLATTAKAGPSITTTLDATLQRRALLLARSHGETLSAKGVAGPAVVVLSLRDSSILAYVGNASPEHMPARDIDGARVRRQPGSLMKPFIFALLAGQGRIAPSTRVYDLPQSWRDYAPRNMDREWRGSMDASAALRQSRNITAVTQLQRLGVEKFATFMNALGLESGSEKQYGLSLALGAKEQSLIRLTNAYAALGRLGVWLPLRFRPDAPEALPATVLSPEASWLALSALSLPERRERPNLVWKTGTSWNQVDAWAVAMTPDIVVGVWCGRLSRGGSDWIAGGDDALPLALAVLDAAGGAGETHWQAPSGIEFRQVCSESGALPGWHCGEKVRSPMLTGSFANQFCRRHTPGERQPDRQQSESANDGQRRLRIVSPLPGATYVTRDGKAFPLPLVAEAEGEITWFVDGKVLGKEKPGNAREESLSPGYHRVSVSDAFGNTAYADLHIVAEVH